MPLIEDILNLQIPKNVSISPNAKQVVYTTSTLSYPKGLDRSVSTIWLANIGVENSARPVTSGEYNDIQPAWSPNSESIAFLTDRTRPGRARGLHILPLRSGQPYVLTDPERGVEEFQWTPDGQSIAFISADEKTVEEKRREIEKDDANVWGQNIVYSRLRLVDVETKKVTTLVEQEEHVNGLAWSPDGTRIAFTHTKEPGLESVYLHGCGVSVIDLKSEGIRRVQHFGSTIGNLKWVGQELFFTANVVPTVLTSAQALWSIDLDSPDPQFEQRAHGGEDCVGDVVQLGQDILISAKHGVSEYLHLLGGEILRTSQGNLFSFDAKLSEDNNIVLATVRSSVGVPDEVFSTTMSTGTQVQLSSHGDIMNAYDFGRAVVLECQSADDQVSIDAIYFSPAKPKGKNGPKGPFPTAVICHGGPYNRSFDAFNPHSTAWEPVLLEAGYGVLCPNYRGSSGRGEKFAAHSRGGLGLADYDDVITLTQLAIEKGYADKDNLLIGGWSNGGAMANLASVRNGIHGLGWKFRAVIAGAGPSDADTMRFTSDFGLVFEAGISNSGAPWDSGVDNADHRSRASAIWSFKKAVEHGDVIPPMLILHCERDRIVPIEQAVAMRRALQYHRLPFEYVSYPREGHRPMEYMHVKDRLERARRWADVYISAD